jgi:hypothetical protein
LEQWMYASSTSTTTHRSARGPRSRRSRRPSVPAKPQNWWLSTMRADPCHDAVAPVFGIRDRDRVDDLHEAGRTGSEGAIRFALAVGRGDEDHVHFGDERLHLLVQMVEHLPVIEDLRSTRRPVPLLQLALASRSRHALDLLGQGQRGTRPPVTPRTRHPLGGRRPPTPTGGTLTRSAHGERCCQHTEGWLRHGVVVTTSRSERPPWFLRRRGGPDQPAAARPAAPRPRPEE